MNKYGVDRNDDKITKRNVVQNGTINDMVAKLNARHIALMVRPTGFGKTFMMITLAKLQLYKKVLYLYPLDVILQSIYNSYHPVCLSTGEIIPPDDMFGIKFAGTEEEHIRYPELPYIEFCTYRKMLEEYKAVAREDDDSISEEERETLIREWVKNRFEGIEALFLDEAHTTGAEGFLKYWPYIKELSTNGKHSDRLDIVGATATPLRTSKSVDIEAEIFYYMIGAKKYSARIRDYGFEDCWSVGIFQRPYYIRALANKQKERDKILFEIVKTGMDKRLSSMGTTLDEVQDELDDLMANIKPLSEMLIDGIQTTDPECLVSRSYVRLLVFYANSSDLLENRADVENELELALKSRGYNQINTYYMTSKTPAMLQSGLTITDVDALIQADIELVKNPDCGIGRADIIHSIDRLNMGYHVGKVTGILTMRATGSEIVYYQQIGRCIDITSDKKPLIIDLANVASELQTRTADTQRIEANKKIKAFINGCTHSVYQNRAVNELYKYTNMCFDSSPLDEELVRYLYIERNYPIYIIAAIAKSLGKKETIDSIVEIVYRVWIKSKMEGELKLDTDLYLEEPRIDNKVKSNIIKPQVKALSRVKQRVRI